MLRRIATVVAVAAVLAPAVGRATDWEESYTNEDDWRQESPPPPTSADTDDDYPVSVDVETPPATIATFDTSLAPYGAWVVVGAYGRVWRPHVAVGWRPYYYGRWEWTNEGWLWVSDEPFGWAAYHYGRWVIDSRYGWVWVPGYEWAPAWVSWRYSGDVVGWAPLAPGVSVYLSATPYADTWWTFVPCRSFVGEPVHRFAFDRSRSRVYFRETTPAPPRPGDRGAGRIVAPAWGGPPPRAIEQRIGRTITPFRVVAASRPGAGRVGAGEVTLFRPGVRPGAPAARPGRGSPESFGRQAQGHGWKGGGQPSFGRDAPATTRPPRDGGGFTQRGWGGSPGEHRGGTGFGLKPPPAVRESPRDRFVPQPAPRHESFGRREAPRAAPSHQGGGRGGERGWHHR
jgi:hypothetical protein